MTASLSELSAQLSGNRYMEHRKDLRKGRKRHEFWKDLRQQADKLAVGCGEARTKSEGSILCRKAACTDWFRNPFRQHKQSFSLQQRIPLFIRRKTNIGKRKKRAIFFLSCENVLKMLELGIKELYFNGVAAKEVLRQRFRPDETRWRGEIRRDAKEGGIIHRCKST